MLEGMQVKLTYVGGNWHEWFEAGDIVSIIHVYDGADILRIQVEKGRGIFGGWMSNSPTDCHGYLIGPASEAEREMISMLYPRIKEYLCLN